MKFREALCSRGNSMVSRIRVSLACSAGVLLERAKLAIVYQTSHVWFGVRVDGGSSGRGKGKKTPA